MDIKLNNPLKPYQTKLTRIKQMWLQPCDVEIYWWILGSFVSVPAILFNIHSPDCLDYAFDRGRVGHRKGRKGSVNPADMAMPLAPPTQGSAWVVFRLGVWSQRVGFFMTVVDGLLDGVIYGTSLAYQLSGCQDPNEGFCNLFFNDTVPFLGFLPGQYMIDSWINGNFHIYGPSAIGINVPAGHHPGCGFTLTQKPFPLNGSKPGWGARLIDSRTNEESLSLSPIDNPDGTRSLTFAWTALRDIEQRHAFHVVVQQSEPGIWYGSGLMSASGTNWEGMNKSFCSKKPGKAEQ